MRYPFHIGMSVDVALILVLFLTRIKEIGIMNLKEDGGMEYRRKALERKEKGEMIKIIFKFKKKKIGMT